MTRRASILAAIAALFSSACRKAEVDNPDLGLNEPRPEIVKPDGTILIRQEDTDQWEIRMRRALAKTLPHPSGCHCCKLPWFVVEARELYYKKGRGMFALCAKCWKQIGNIEVIIEYHRELWRQWEADPVYYNNSTIEHADWNDIEDAIRNGDAKNHLTWMNECAEDQSNDYRVFPQWRATFPR